MQNLKTTFIPVQTFVHAYTACLNCRRLFLLLIPFVTLIFASPTANAQTQTTHPLSITERIQQPFWGDLKELRQRRIIRVLVSYSRTNFFVTQRGYRGVEHDLLLAYEKYLNRGPLKQRFKTQLVFVPVPFKDVLQNLVDGKGDIAASGLTILPERKKMVDFTKPYIKDIKEVLISGNHAAPIKSIFDLSGKGIVVVANSSYIIHLTKINQALGQLGFPPIEIIQADPVLEAEDILAMVNAGIYDYSVVDDHIAGIWSQVLENISVNHDIIFHYNGQIGWAINKDIPNLKKSLNRFVQAYAKPGRLLGNSTFQKYFESTYWIKKPLTQNLLKKVDCLETHLRTYSDYFGFDWRLIAAQAYQESHFDQSRKSHRGAMGIMQIKPMTAAEKYIRIKGIDKLENNLHAGIKYLAFLRDHYFHHDRYSEEDKTNFALASYNAGPTRIRRFQKEAKRKGLNPNKWFYNVEIIARNHIGHETVNYVASIQKTKLFFSASYDLDQQRRLFLDETEKDRQASIPSNTPVNLK